MATLMLAEHESAQGETWMPRPAFEPRPPEWSARGRILLVEDDAFVRGFIERLLTEAGYAVTTAAHGAEALAVTDGAELDLVVTDVRMPVMDGRELGARLRGLRPGLPVIYISGYDADVSSLAPNGGAAFLRKPFAPEELLSRIEELLRPR